MKWIQSVVGGVRKVIKYMKFVLCIGDILDYAAWRLDRVDKGESATAEDFAKFKRDEKQD